MGKPKEDAKSPDQFYVFTRTSFFYVMNLQGQVTGTFSSGKREGGDFVASGITPQGSWVFTAAEDGQLYCFDMRSKQLEHIMGLQVQKGVVCVAVHPRRNLAAVASMDGSLSLLVP